MRLEKGYSSSQLSISTANLLLAALIPFFMLLTFSFHINISKDNKLCVCMCLQVMKWFWAVVSSFTQEELARLLQFTTGSSQLPPGGFNTLCPSFQIIAAPTHSSLPTAHTW